MSSAKAAITNRGIALQMMSRIFKKNVRKCLSKWRKKVSLQNEGLQRTLEVFKERPE